MKVGNQRSSPQGFSSKFSYSDYERELLYDLSWLAGSQPNKVNEIRGRISSAFQKPVQLARFWDMFYDMPEFSEEQRERIKTRVFANDPGFYILAEIAFIRIQKRPILEEYLRRFPENLTEEGEKCKWCLEQDISESETLEQRTVWTLTGNQLVTPNGIFSNKPADYAMLDYYLNSCPDGIYSSFNWHERSYPTPQYVKETIEAEVARTSGSIEGKIGEVDEYEETIFSEDVNYDELLEDWSSYGEIVENAKMLGTISGPVSQIAGAVTTVGGLATTGAVAAGFGVAGATVAVFAGAAILSQEILKRRYKRFFALHTALSGELAYAYINETDEYVSPQGIFRKLKNQGKKIWKNIDREGLDYSMWVERNPGIETALVCIYHEAMHKNPVNNPKLALEGLYELAKELYSQPPPRMSRWLLKIR